MTSGIASVKVMLAHYFRSLIAIVLGQLKTDVDSCIDAYVDIADSIFQQVAHRVTLGGKAQARFDSRRLEEAIKATYRQKDYLRTKSSWKSKP